MEHSVEEKISFLCEGYLNSLAGIRDLTARMENVTAAQFEITSEAVLYTKGIKALGREILRLEIEQFLYEITAIRESIGERYSSRFGQEFNLNAPTVAKQSEALELVLVEPNRKRGQYVGPVVGLDHRSVLVKFSEKNSIELLFSELDQSQTKPQMGDTVRVGFKTGKLVASVQVSQRNIRKGAVD